MSLRRSGPMKRSRMKRPKLTEKRQERRERRASWAIRGKAREGQCRRCRGPFGLASHHMYARGTAGGAKIDEDWNHISLCLECHDWVHLHRIEAQALGLLAHVGDCSDIEPVGASDREAR